MEALWKYDLPHIGAMFKNIRESRGLTQKEIKNLGSIDNTRISKFEAGGDNGKIVDGYIHALRKLPSPLSITSRDEEVLKSLLDHSLEKKKREEEGAVFAFDEIKSNWLKTEFRNILTRLEQENNPAAILDSYWFVHAVNGSLLRMYNTNPSSAYLYNWEAWHSMATKFQLDSLIRQAYVNSDEYLGPSVNQFFMDENVQRFFFTYQMRTLLHRIFELSEENDFKFAKWWSKSVTLDLDFKLNSLSRIHRFGKRTIITDAGPKYEANVPITQDHTAKYRLIVWDPMSEEAKEVFDHLRTFPDSHTIFFAADYDKNHDFHINNWPEIKRWWNNTHL